MRHISTDGEKFWPFFGVLPRKIPCGDTEILQFYLCGRQPLLSILKFKKMFASRCSLEVFHKENGGGAHPLQSPLPRDYPFFSGI